MCCIAGAPLKIKEMVVIVDKNKSNNNDPFWKVALFITVISIVMGSMLSGC